MLFIQDIRIESAARFQAEPDRRPRPIRVRFGSLKERNAVLAASRSQSGRVRVKEDFTSTVMFHRKMLAAFARKRAQQTK